MPKICLNLSEKDHKSFKLIAMIEKKSMSAILTELIQKRAKKIDTDKMLDLFRGTGASSQLTGDTQT